RPWRPLGIQHPARRRRTGDHRPAAGRRCGRQQPRAAHAAARRRQPARFLRPLRSGTARNPVRCRDLGALCARRAAAGHPSHRAVRRAPGTGRRGRRAARRWRCARRRGGPPAANSNCGLSFAGTSQRICRAPCHRRRAILTAVNTFQKDVDEYEAWLRAHCRVVKADLKEKHRRMRKNVFAFLRATYFRWARTIESVCPELSAAPVVACVGDIHVENFGTWRDADGRLVWGVNDYDEAAFMPYAFDLVRLATSACLSPPAKADAAKVVAAVLDGYRAGLADPRAVLLDQHAGWLREFAEPTPRATDDFWRELDD